MGLDLADNNEFQYHQQPEQEDNSNHHKSTPPKVDPYHHQSTPPIVEPYHHQSTPPTVDLYHPQPTTTPKPPSYSNQPIPTIYSYPKLITNGIIKPAKPGQSVNHY